MSTQAASSATVSVAAADTKITSALTYPVKASLLTIGQGSDHTAADEIRFVATGGSIIEIVDSVGKRVGICPGNGQAVVVAAVAGDPGEWAFQVLPQAPAAHQATPTAQQAWDVLRNAGLVDAE